MLREQNPSKRNKAEINILMSDKMVTHYLIDVVFFLETRNPFNTFISFQEFKKFDSRKEENVDMITSNIEISATKQKLVT